MKAVRMHLITKWWLVAILTLAPLQCIVFAEDKGAFDEQVMRVAGSEAPPRFKKYVTTPPRVEKEGPVYVDKTSIVFNA
jgi:hypothetical protein